MHAALHCELGKVSRGKQVLFDVILSNGLIDSGFAPLPGTAVSSKKCRLSSPPPPPPSLPAPKELEFLFLQGDIINMQSYNANVASLLIHNILICLLVRVCADKRSRPKDVDDPRNASYWC